jgi:hypothetical protein
MSRQEHARTIRNAAVAIAALLAAAGVAGAEEQRRVVVADFDGQGPTPKVAHEAVVKIISDFYEVLPYSKYRIARRRLNITEDSMKAVAEVARKVGADAIVEGVMSGRELTISVREGRSGRVVDRFKVAIQSHGVSAETRERLTDELVDLIDWTEPLHNGADEPTVDRTAIADPTDDDAPQAAPVPVEKKPPPAPPKWTTDEPVRIEEKSGDRRPPPIQVSGSVGVAATARRLEFSHKTNLAENERPLGMSGSPSAGVAFTGTFDVDALGVSAEAIYQRSVGASVSYPVGRETKQVGITLSHMAGRLTARRKVSKRVTLRGGAGYHQLSFAMQNRPAGLLIPDSRYGFVDFGGGARFSLRDDRLALTAELRYLYVLAAGGITDPTVYGSSRFQGFGGEAGLEIQATDSTFVRLAGTFDRIVLSFNGDGQLTDLDESGDVDVSGAADTFIGWAVMLGFRL